MFASLTDVYIASAAAGGDTGADCANAHAATFFNTAGNWGAGGSQIGSDTTVHLCSTFTGSSGGTVLTFQGSGTAGHPITLKWEAGAIVQAPYCSTTNGCINTNSKTNLVIDGGTNGILQSTANGTNLANQQNDILLSASTCTNCEFKNLTMSGYVHVGTADLTGGGDSYALKMLGGNSVTVDHMTVHDCGWCLYFAYSTNSNYSAHDNHVYNCNGCMVVGNNGAVTVTGVLIYNNEVNDTVNWDDTADNNHHDFMHLWAVSASSGFVDVQIYNNYFHGDAGIHTTAQIFVEANGGGAGSGNLAIFGNIFTGTNCHADALANGAISLQANNWLVAYNTLKCDTSANDTPIAFQWDSGTGHVYKGNIVSNWPTAFYYPSGGSGISTSDFNDFFTIGTSTGFNYGTSHSTLASWKSATGFDTNSVSSDPQLNSDFTLQSGSPMRSFGPDLTSTCVTYAALCTDRNGTARPNGSNWDAGALQFVNTAPPSSNPTRFRFLRRDYLHE